MFGRKKRQQQHEVPDTSVRVHESGYIMRRGEHMVLAQEVTSPEGSGWLLVTNMEFFFIHYTRGIYLHLEHDIIESVKHDKRPDPLLFSKPVRPTFQAHFRQAARSASHSSLWFTSPQTTSLIRSYFFSGFRYLSPIIRHVLTFRMACST